MEEQYGGTMWRSNMEGQYGGTMWRNNVEEQYGILVNAHALYQKGVNVYVKIRSS